jgi:signal transduction histidine kinase
LKCSEEIIRKAEVGELIDFVAHQWLQPITVIYLYLEFLEEDFENGDVDKKYIEQFRHKLYGKLDHLVEVLKEFRGFLKDNGRFEKFSLTESIHRVLTILEDYMKSAQVNIDIEIDKDIYLFGSKVRIEAIFVNILKNSREALVEHRSCNRRIGIKAKKKGKYIKVHIYDNGGGIEDFDSLFKYKSKKVGGSGMGLYFSKKIIESIGGKIEAKNSFEGAEFVLKIPIEFARN